MIDIYSKPAIMSMKISGSIFSEIKSDSIRRLTASSPARPRSFCFQRKERRSDGWERQWGKIIHSENCRTNFVGTTFIRDNLLHTCIDVWPSSTSMRAWAMDRRNRSVSTSTSKLQRPKSKSSRELAVTSFWEVCYLTSYSSVHRNTKCRRLATHNRYSPIMSSTWPLDCSWPCRRSRRSARSSPP